MEEIWVDIKGYEGIYQVSNLGRVRSLDREVIYPDGHKQICKGKILNQGNNGEYKVVVLSKNSETKTFLVHRLVAEAFIPNKDNKPFVDHIVPLKNKGTNSANNLKWVTYEENNNNPLTRKNMSYGCKGRKLTNEQIDKISKAQYIRVVQLDKNTNELIKVWDSMSIAKREGGFNDGHISSCCKGVRKTHKGYKWMYYEDYIKLNEKGEM